MIKFHFFSRVLILLFFIGNCSYFSKESNDNTKNLTLAALALRNSTSTTTYPIVDTNQTTCYSFSTGAVVTCTGTGYDADYTRNSPSYTKNSAGTIITDNVTGLMWTQTADIDGNGTLNSSDKKSQTNAIAYCDALTTGGYTDWRLPDIKTLYSLIQFSGKDASSDSTCSTAGSTACVTSSLTPFLSSTFDWAFGDVSANERVIDAQYATSTTYTSTTMNNNATMFGVNFIDGRIKGYPKTIVSTGADNTFYVRCVRGNTSYGVNNFVSNGDTISDYSTGLMWQTADADSTSFDNAISICEAATTSNYSDWRLPNAKELQSIVDYTRSPAYTSSAAIDSKFTATSITNENGQTDYAY